MKAFPLWEGFFYSSSSPQNLVERPTRCLIRSPTVCVPPLLTRYDDKYGRTWSAFVFACL